MELPAVNPDKAVMQYWDEKKAVHPGVSNLSKGRLQEIVDALPYGLYSELARELRFLASEASEESPVFVAEGSRRKRSRRQ
jgi:hypothetical protein